MTSDKFVYLFDGLSWLCLWCCPCPCGLSPLYGADQGDFQREMRGRDISNGGLIKRAKHGIKILSILVTWALENAIDTADSMKDRGWFAGTHRLFHLPL